MNGFEMLEIDKQTIVDNGLFSTKCILYSPDGKIQGRGSTLSENDPDYDKDDKLGCFAPFIGIDISTDTGLGIFADRAEITINMTSVKIGVVDKDWLIDIYFPSIKEWKKFKCEHVAIDRMLGIYLIKPTIAKDIPDITSLRTGKF